MIEAVRAACLASGEPDPLDEASLLRLKHQGLGGARVWAEDAGFALVRDGVLDLAVSPAARNHGLGGRLARLALDDATVDSAWSHGDHPAAARLADRVGFTPTRELWVMRRPTGVPLPTAVVPPALTVRSYRPEDRDALLRVNAAAFAAHPEQGAMGAEDLAARMAEPWYDARDLLLAIDDSSQRLLGFHWTKRHSPDLGEVYVVGIDPLAQGRGLGRLLTLAGLHHLTDLGVAEVLLYVESDNAPALALYSGLGFTHAPADTHVQYTRRG